MESIHGSISGQLGKCIEELEKTESPSENNLSELDGVINQIAKIPLNNKFDTQLDRLTHLIPNKYKNEDGSPILEKISSIKTHVFSEEETLTWIQKKASEGIEQTMGLIEDLHQFDLKNLPRSSLLDLWLLIVKQGEKAQVSFVKNLDKLGLDPLECLKLCSIIVEKNPGFEKILYSELKKDLFIGEIVKLQLTERLNFCENFAGTGKWAINFLKRYFDNLKFVQEIPALDQSQRIPLCKKLAENGLWTSKGLISNCNQLGLDKIESPVLIELWTKLAETGGAYELAEKFSQIGLEKASVDQKFFLCIRLIDQSESAGIILLEKWKNLGIKEASKTQMIQLCGKIIEKGNSYSISSLIDNFSNLHYSDFSHSEKFSLAMKLIERAYYPCIGANILIHNFSKFQLDNLKSHQFVELWKKMIDNSVDCELLIKNLQAVGLEKVPISERLSFYMHIAELGHASSLLENFSMLGLKDASTEDRLALVIKLAQQGARKLSSKLSKLGLEQIESSQLIDLYTTIIRKSTLDTVTDLVENWDVNKLLEVEPSQRLPLWIAMAKSGEVGARKSLDLIELLNPEKIEPSTLLELWISIARQGMRAPTLPPTLLKNMISMGAIKKLSLEERLELGRAMAESCKNSDEVIAASIESPLADHFDKFGFIEDFEACESLKARVELCNRIALESGNWAVAGLIQNFNKLGFEEATPAQRLDLCSTLARKGLFPAQSMAGYFPQLGFGRTSEDTEARFKLCCLIIGIEGPMSLQEDCAMGLARNIDDLGIEEVSYQNKVDFTMDLANKGEWIAMHLTSKLGFFSPQRNEVLDCLNLSINLADKENAAKNIADNFEALKLPYSSMTESEIQKLIFLLNTLIRNRVSFRDLPLKGPSISDEMIVKIYPGILLDTSLPPEQLSTVLEDPRVRDIKPCLELILFKLPLEKDPDYGQKKEEFLSLQKNFQNLLESRSEFKLFKDQFVKIKSQDSIFIQSQLIKVLAYATSIFSDLEPMALDAIMKSHLIEAILSHQNPTDRFLLTKELRIAASENIQDIKDLSRDDNLSTKAEQVSLPSAPLKNIEKDWGKLSSLLLSHLKTLGLSQEATEAILLSIDQRGFSTTKNLTILLSFLHNLIQKGPYSSEKMQGQEVSEKDLLENYLIKTVWDNKALEKIKFLSPKTITELKDGKKTRTKVEQEDPMKNILGRTEIIKLETKKPIKKKSKTMAEVQVEIEGSDNILTIFDRKQFFEFLRSNQESSKFFMEHFQELFPVGKIADFNEKFASTFGNINKFRDPKALYTYVKQLKKLPKEEKDAVNKILTEYVSSVLNGTFKEERYSTKDNPHLEIIFKDPKLKKAWLQAEAPKHIANELYISESDDPCDLLLIGTEVQGSCQSVTSNPSTSKCLPHYLMGGEIIPIVVKDLNGRLVARSVLRHLIDEKNNSILLQEKIYTNKPGDLEIEKEINEWAIRKAQSMNCPLVSMREQSEKYNGKVKFLGGRAPFQYTDAGGGVKSGPYEIDGLSLIYSPSG